jgi:hypothetical protein
LELEPRGQELCGARFRCLPGGLFGCGKALYLDVFLAVRIQTTRSDTGSSQHGRAESGHTTFTLHLNQRSEDQDAYWALHGSEKEYLLNGYMFV